MDNKRVNKKIITVVVILIIVSIIAALNINGKIKRDEAQKYNVNYIDNYIKDNFPDYTLVSKGYQYLDNFWSTYYSIDEDHFDKTILSNARMKNNETGLSIVIPFEHEAYRKYSLRKYDSNTLKKKVRECESFYEKLKDIESQYITEMKINVMDLDSDSRSDIFYQIIYVKFNKNIDVNELANQIYYAKSPLVIRTFKIILINDENYDELLSLDSSSDMMEYLESTKDDVKFDVAEFYYNENSKVKRYYNIKK